MASAPREQCPWRAARIGALGLVMLPKEASKGKSFMSIGCAKAMIPSVALHRSCFPVIVSRSNGRADVKITAATQQHPLNPPTPQHPNAGTSLRSRYRRAAFYSSSFPAAMPSLARRPRLRWRSSWSLI